jgi:hypothetical protein
MSGLKRAAGLAGSASLALFVLALPAISGTPAATETPAAAQGAGDAHVAVRDGQHDFDFDLGNWKTHSSRLLHPLTGSTDWLDMDGVTIVKKIWGGRANLAEFKADGPAGHLELLSLRTYNPTTRQWSLNFATPKVGTGNSRRGGVQERARRLLRPGADQR